MIECERCKERFECCDACHRKDALTRPGMRRRTYCIAYHADGQALHAHVCNLSCAVKFLKVALGVRIRPSGMRQVPDFEPKPEAELRRVKAMVRDRQVEESEVADIRG